MTNKLCHAINEKKSDFWPQALSELSSDRRQAMTFLYRHLPESDLDCYPFSLFLSFADHALFLREKVSWCGELDQEIFRHYVLFPRVNDEDLSFHRRLFYDALWPRIQNLSTVEERILEVNRWCHEIASYQFQDDRTASPLTVFRSGSGRCGEESAFLVSALRSVGIAARQVYAPRWSHCDDNHAWVEALCCGQWRFLGACEPEPVLDRGWFNTAASQAVLVHSRLFGTGSSPLHGELLHQDGGVCWYNQTPRYAPVRTCVFRAMRQGIPAAGAAFQIQVLNEASFHTIASLTADEQGEARAVLGLGDIHVLAVQDDLWAEGDCTDEGITLQLLSPRTEEIPDHISDQSAGWTDFQFHAPNAGAADSACTLLDAGQRAVRAAVLREGAALRTSRIASLNCSDRGKTAWKDLLKAARGNGHVIAAFLERDGNPLREALLRTLTDKDLRDVTDETLEDHLPYTPPFIDTAEAGRGPSSGITAAPEAFSGNAFRDIPPEIYNSYVLCPRIEQEPLTPWRRALKEHMSLAEQEAWRDNPSALWANLNRRMDLHRTQTYANLVWTPLEAWQARRCDYRSLRILFVAVLRTLGIPARLRPLDGMPEFWQNGAFHCVLPEETGTLRLTYAGSLPLVYRRHWTLSRQTRTGWQLFRLSDEGWQDGGRTVTLPVGKYRLITTARLPNGTQFAARRDVLIQSGKEQTVRLSLRSYSLEDMLYRHPLPVMAAETPDGRHVPDLCRMTGCPSVLLWLEEGREPTEHVINELAASRRALDCLPAEVILLLRGRDSLRHPSLSGLLSQWGGIRVLLDDWSYDLESVARQLTCDPSAPPLAVVCDGNGQAVYGVSGYHAGSVELLVRVTAFLCQGSESPDGSARYLY